MFFYLLSQPNRKKDQFGLFDFRFAEDYSRMAPGVLDHDGGDVVVVRGIRVVRNGRSAAMGRPGAVLSA